VVLCALTIGGHDNVHALVAFKLESCQATDAADLLEQQMQSYRLIVSISALQYEAGAKQDCI